MQFTAEQRKLVAQSLRDAYKQAVDPKGRLGVSVAASFLAADFANLDTSLMGTWQVEFGDFVKGRMGPKQW